MTLNYEATEDLTDTVEIEEVDNTEQEEVLADAEENTEAKEIELEDTPKKTYTEDELEEIAKERERRAIRKKEREYEKQLKKYRELEELMKAGTSKSNIDEIISATSEFYKEEGIEIPKNETRYSDDEIEVIAKYKAQKILDLEDVEGIEEELDYLAKKGRANMTKEEQVIFQTLGEYVMKEKDTAELKAIGVDKDVLESPEFKDLRAKYNGSAKEVYDLYKKIYVKEEAPKVPSTMKTSPAEESKDFYSEAEVEKLLKKYTPSDLAKNPSLFEKIKNSMGSW